MTPIPQSTLIGLRAAVAEAIDLRETEVDIQIPHGFYARGRLEIYCGSSNGVAVLWQPDIDPAQAMAVLKKCRSEVRQKYKTGIHIESVPRGIAVAVSSDNKEHWTVAETDELAICLFALRLHAPDHPVLKKLK